jgi:uncharacterized membrane protein
MRVIIHAIVLLAIATVAARADSAATIKEESQTVTQGSIVIDAPASDVYALLTDYANWKRYLTDIATVKVKSGGGRDAVVEMKSRALEHTVTVKFDNTANKLVTFKLVDGPPGARAWGEYTLVPIGGGNQTRIDARLYMDVVGAAGIFVTDRRIRKMRQAKLRADLEDLARWVRLQNRNAKAQ